MKKMMLAVVVCATALAQGAVNLTGTWRIHWRDDNGVSTSMPKLVLEQSGGKLTGTFGKYDWPVIGTVDGNHVVFTFIGHGCCENGKPMSDTVFYWGTVDEKGNLKGRMKNPKEAGDWVASRE
jgi:hypothetical protein